MLPPLDLQDAILTAWRTNSRVTGYPIEQIPVALWSAAVPGVPTRTVRAHHRGQIVMVARQLNHCFSVAVAAELWQWRSRDRGAPR